MNAIPQSLDVSILPGIITECKRGYLWQEDGEEALERGIIRHHTYEERKRRWANIPEQGTTEGEGRKA